MPITLLEMVSFEFRFKVKRDRNAGGTERFVLIAEMQITNR